MSDCAVEWVIARPEKANYLVHLAPASGEPAWASRHVSTLCGWSGFAGGGIPGEVTHRDKERWPSGWRRKCERCVKKAQHEGLVIR